MADTQSLANAEWESMRRSVELQRQSLIASAKQELETWAALRRTILEWLELDEGTSSFAVQRRIAALRASCDADERVQKVEMRLRQAQNAVSIAVRSLESLD